MTYLRHCVRAKCACSALSGPADMFVSSFKCFNFRFLCLKLPCGPQHQIPTPKIIECLCSRSYHLYSAKTEPHSIKFLVVECVLVNCQTKQKVNPVAK